MISLYRYLQKRHDCLMQLVPRYICVQKPVNIDLKVHAAYDQCASLKVEGTYISVCCLQYTKQEKSLVTYLSIR